MFLIQVLSENPRLAFWSSMKEKRTALHRAAGKVYSQNTLISQKHAKLSAVDT